MKTDLNEIIQRMFNGLQNIAEVLRKALIL